MKMYLYGAVALSTTVTMATADMDFHVDFGQALGEGYMTSTMATDYDKQKQIRRGIYDGVFDLEQYDAHIAAIRAQNSTKKCRG